METLLEILAGALVVAGTWGAAWGVLFLVWRALLYSPPMPASYYDVSEEDR